MTVEVKLAICILKKQESDLNDSSHACFFNQEWLNTRMHNSKKQVSSSTSLKPETRCECDAVSQLKQSFTENYIHECSTADSCNNEKETDNSIDSVSESDVLLYAVLNLNKLT